MAPPSLDSFTFADDSNETLVSNNGFMDDVKDVDLGSVVKTEVLDDELLSTGKPLSEIIYSISPDIHLTPFSGSSCRSALPPRGARLHHLHPPRTRLGRVVRTFFFQARITYRGTDDTFTSPP